MPARRAALLLLLALLLAAGAVLLLRGHDAPPAPALELPAPPVEHAPPPARVESEPPVERTGAVPKPPAPAAEPTEDLRAEGARRGWQLPLGKGWWTDELINPTAVEPQGAEITALQDQLVLLADRLNALRQRRKQRLDAHCQERIAAGLAVADPQGVEVLPEGKEHVVVTTHTVGEPTKFWRVDVGPGDDAEIDRLDRLISEAWCAAVIDLRARFAALKR